MEKESLFRVRELIDQINREALMQIVENELKGYYNNELANEASLHRIAELSVEAKDRIKKVLGLEL